MSGFFFCGMIDDPVANPSSSSAAERRRGPEHHLLADARQVHPDERRHEQELGHEVPVGDGVDGVGGRGGESQLGGDLRRVQRQRGAGERTGAERADRRPRVPVPQPVEVAQQRLDVGQQLVAEADRLGRLQVGEAGRRGVDVPAGLLGDGLGQLDHPGRHAAGVVT
jgi:hypothetical protein